MCNLAQIALESIVTRIIAVDSMATRTKALKFIVNTTNNERGEEAGSTTEILSGSIFGK